MNQTIQNSTLSYFFLKVGQVSQSSHFRPFSPHYLPTTLSIQNPFVKMRSLLFEDEEPHAENTPHYFSLSFANEKVNSNELLTFRCRVQQPFNEKSVADFELKFGDLWRKEVKQQLVQRKTLTCRNTDIKLEIFIICSPLKQSLGPQEIDNIIDHPDSRITADSFTKIQTLPTEESIPSQPTQKFRRSSRTLIKPTKIRQVKPQQNLMTQSKFSEEASFENEVSCRKFKMRRSRLVAQMAEEEVEQGLEEMKKQIGNVMYYWQSTSCFPPRKCEDNDLGCRCYIEDYNCCGMKEEVLYKLNIISLLPWKVTVSSLAIIESQSFPVLKLQVWIDNILLDQTFHLKFNEGIDAAGNRTIHLAEKPFRYFTRQLFSRSKVARLKVKLLRGNWDWTTTEEVETFNLVLSEYSYEFSKSKFNQFQEHLVGVIRGAILHFKIQCEYDDQRSRLSAEEESRPEREIKSTQKQDFIDQMLLPMQSLTVDYAFKDKEDSSSSVFIETQQMKAVYRDEDITNKKLRFKVEGSVMNAGDNDSQFRSIIKETRKLKDSTSTFCTVLFFTYMVLCGVIIVLQMFPKRKF